MLGVVPKLHFIYDLVAPSSQVHDPMQTHLEQASVHDLHAKGLHHRSEMLAPRRMGALGGAREYAYQAPHHPALRLDVVTWDSMGFTGLGLGESLLLIA